MTAPPFQVDFGDKDFGTFKTVHEKTRFQMKAFKTILLGFVVMQLSASCDLFSGCGRDNALRRLTEESIKWTPYQVNAELVFESDASRDTILVTQYQDGTESYFRGDECPAGEMQVLKAKLFGKFFSDTISFKIHSADIVTLENEDFFTEARDSGEKVTVIGSVSSYMAILTINQKTFTEAIVSKCPTCVSLKEIVFAKNVGLVAYKIEDIYWTRK